MKNSSEPKEEESQKLFVFFLKIRYELFKKIKKKVLNLIQNVLGLKKKNGKELKWNFKQKIKLSEIKIYFFLRLATRLEPI